MEETANDIPRLNQRNKPVYTEDFEVEDPEKCRELYYSILEHARDPGAFDYTQPQTQHAVFPDVEQEAYVTINGKDHRKLKISNFSV